MHPSTDKESLCTSLGILWNFGQVMCPMAPLKADLAEAFREGKVPQVYLVLDR